MVAAVCEDELDVDVAVGVVFTPVVDTALVLEAVLDAAVELGAGTAPEASP